MKTPKREQEKCWRCGGDLVVRHGCSGSFCPTCNYYVNVSPRLLEQHARWTRKNREARLRHALREMKWQIEVKKVQLKGCWSACVTYRKAVSASGTFGQDIEGS